MMFRSRYPDTDVPSVPLTTFVLGESRDHDDRLAFVEASTGRGLTFADVRTQVRQLAAGLSGRLRKGQVAAIWAPNLPEYAVVFHAVVSSGAILTTINPAYTSHEAAFQLRDAGAVLLFTTGALAARAREAVAASGLDIDIVTIDEADGLPSMAAIMRDGNPPVVDIDPGVDLAVLPYSSGATGLAKGVMLTHRNLVANLRQVDAMEASTLPALIGVLPFFHIYGMTVIMNLGLLRRATVVTLPRFDLEQFLQVLQDWPIPLAHIVPPIAVALAKHPSVYRYDLSGVRWLFSGAAPLGAELTAALGARLGVVTRQGYGLTETSPAACYTPPGEERPGKAGELVPGTECRIVCTQTGRLLGCDEPGEVLIRGPQVMAGYWDNPDATAATLDGDGWLRTGDIGCIGADGYLTIVDRLKELIKVKGYQVAPAELEALLLEHPAIADVAVIPVADEDSGEVPKAWVVARGPVTADDVKAFVEPRVAPYKRIRHVAFIDAIPKSPSGKILRRVLVERERAMATVVDATTSTRDVQ
ncbi:MAG TPA: AMP-binding protein [Luteitalea sp.]|nr:AMP-binding protein [Luteitalea sp.]